MKQLVSQVRPHLQNPNINPKVLLPQARHLVLLLRLVLQNRRESLGSRASVDSTKEKSQSSRVLSVVTLEETMRMSQRFYPFPINLRMTIRKAQKLHLEEQGTGPKRAMTRDKKSMTQPRCMTSFLRPVLPAPLRYQCFRQGRDSREEIKRGQLPTREPGHHRLRQNDGIEDGLAAKAPPA